MDTVPTSCPARFTTGTVIESVDPASGAVETIETPERLCSYAFVSGEDRRILAAFETGMAYFDVETKAVDWIDRPETLGSGRRFNDGRTDFQGRFWVGTMVENEEKVGPDTGALFRLDRNGLSAEAVCARVKHWAKVAGLDPADFGGHSLRAGFITTAARRGRDLDSIIVTTGHRSEHTARGYIQR